MTQQNEDRVTANDNAAPGAYSATTHAIRVLVRPLYLEEQSAPEESHYVWAYHVTIENHGSEVVQLISRHWRITDGQGRLQEVQGPGVVGEQPVLRPGQAFEYTSGCPLSTPSGFMAGTYQMLGENGRTFDIDIPAFSLDGPADGQRMH